jgi:hypothetical protein
MSEGNDRRTVSDEGSLSAGFRESVPLIVVTVVLLLVGAIAWIFNIAVGSARFPLGVILVTLGFIAGIGATLSWFFAGSPRRASTEPRPPPVDRPRNEAARATGRPAPDVRWSRTRSTVASPRSPRPWEEKPTDVENSPLSIPSVASPAPDPRALIEELDQLTRELAPTRPPSSARPAASRRPVGEGEDS